jgi:hypothetical protein
LTKVTVPGSVTTIGTGAFLYCYALTSIEVDASSYNYASVDGVLYNKTITTLIQCPAGKAGVFTIPESVKTIGPRAFNTCPFLSSIIIPGNVTNIGEYAFIQCASLTSIEVDTSSSTYASVNGVLYNKTITTLIQCPSGKAGELIIPDSVRSIGVWSCSYCPSLTSITVPGNVTAIGYGAFYSCTALTSITFLGLVAPTVVGGQWIAGTSTGIMGHAYAASDFPAQGNTFNALVMGAAIPIIPSAPRNITTVRDNTQAGLAWIAPINNGGSPITGYSVYRSAGENGTYALITSTSGLNYTDTNTTNGQTYWYKVAATNVNGEGVNSTAVSVSIPQKDDTLLILAAVISIAIILVGAVLLIQKRKGKK